VDSPARAAGRRTPACVALGSNLGDREAHLTAAIAALRALAETEVEAVSRIHETEPVGPPPQGPYLNAVVRIRTGLDAPALLERLRAIEGERGRVRSGGRNRARTLDLDLLLFGDAIIDRPGLVVPHPRLHQRRFVLDPLAEVAGAWRHPVLGASIAELAAQLSSNSQ